ncbi:hypothetical protein K438DRAFT_1800009 [Mycena galopus ATCC 62051]|nr:hypothetical protein K438DRAFT_1800009 [Mycena galopus ATCC 62051]
MTTRLTLVARGLVPFPFPLGSALPISSISRCIPEIWFCKSRTAERLYIMVRGNSGSNEGPIEWIVDGSAGV